MDKSLSIRLYQDIGRHIPRRYMLLLEHAGNGLFWIPVAVIGWFIPAASPFVRCCLANLFLGFLVDLALVGALKGLARRQRPVYNQAGDFLLVVSVDKFSFPSGHASRASFIAAFACTCLAPYSLSICLAASLVGVTVALSRALMGRHYLGDVAAGLMLGLLTTAVVTRGTFTTQGFWIGSTDSEYAYRRVMGS
ncbi:hypothetical protein WJX72_003069 [[Myrmecia] bisecta]|uniref:Phosphatidic acid phosphatase type 2/haloperoxidase domain-containing protein n=1 Tax=[Myrmecia] bisecta TaxID=41462 RepID=A0AAW1R588_9CHLO